MSVYINLPSFNQSLLYLKNLTNIRIKVRRIIGCNFNTVLERNNKQLKLETLFKKELK